jgi:uncharacterized damage-inducible protein DinB
MAPAVPGFVTLQPLPAAIFGGWRTHNQRLIEVIAPLTYDQVQLRPSTEHWAIWQLASNIAGGRAYWLHDILGEGDQQLRDMFRVTQTTVPDLPLTDAGWEDDENQPRTAEELTGALTRTWQLVEDCIGRWSTQDLAVEFTRDRGRVRRFTRAWVIWHMIEHAQQHGSEIALILRANGLPTIQL